MTGQSSSASPEAQGRGWSWSLPAATFLAGLALGAVVMGVGSVGGAEQEPTAPGPSAAAAGDADGAADDAAGGADDDAGLYVRVPDSCVQTADDATTLVEHVDRVVAAVADLEPERLRQTVDEVQQIRDEVSDVAQQCREAAAQRLEDAAELEAPDDVDTDAASPAP
jgi:hypothetical protein